MKIHDIVKQAKSYHSDWGWVAAYVPTTMERELKKIHRQIDQEDLYDEEGYGVEKEPHVTIAYGLDSNVLPNRMKLTFALATPVTFRVDNISTFDNDDYTVLKYAVKSGELSYLRRRVREDFGMPGNSYNHFNPHITIAYLKKGADVDKYKKKFKYLVGKSYTTTKAVYDPKGYGKPWKISIGRDQNAEMKKVADINLDIDEGDTLLTGRFKNKPMEVKDIGTDEKGQPTVNSKKLLAVRIKKLMPEKKAAINQDQIREAAHRYVDQYEQAAEELDKQMPEDERLNLDKTAEINMGRAWYTGFADACRAQGIPPIDLL